MPATATTTLGIKYAAAIAGFIGALVTLSFLGTLTRLQAFSAVFTGSACAFYLTPIVMLYWSIPSTVIGGVGFLIGMTSLHIVPAILHLASLAREDATGIFKALFKR